MQAREQAEQMRERIAGLEDEARNAARDAGLIEAKDTEIARLEAQVQTLSANMTEEERKEALAQAALETAEKQQLVCARQPFGPPVAKTEANAQCRSRVNQGRSVHKPAHIPLGNAGQEG